MPCPFRCIYVALLTSLRSAAEKQDKRLAIPPEIYPISGAGMNAELVNAISD